MKYLIILQARVNSQRLHGKVLKKIRDIPLVILCAKRLKNTRKPLIVAIPKDKSNLCLKRLIKNKINYSVGPNKNVFSRFKKIISKIMQKQLSSELLQTTLYRTANLLMKC